jgi:hypothetical protein
MSLSALCERANLGQNNFEPQTVKNFSEESITSDGKLEE